MANLSGENRSQYVHDMFTGIARRYDLMNRIMTAGQDVRWRKWVIKLAALPAQGRLLDLGAGTGDLARQALRQYPQAFVLAADFTLEMMRVGKARTEESIKVKHWAAADALRLPFPNGFFDAVVSGFLLRNLSSVEQSLNEQFRVLKPGGQIVTLDTSPPPANLLSPFIRFHLHTIIPLLGRILTGQAEAYKYLPDTTEGFLKPEQLAARLEAAGFTRIGFRRLMFGTIAIHWGQKPGAQHG